VFDNAERCRQHGARRALEVLRVPSSDVIDAVPANWARIIADGYLGAEGLEIENVRAQKAD
jgi:hypothetical protein